MAGGGLLRLWQEWGVHAMVLASFALQLFLLAFGGTRRYSSSTKLRIALWLAYLSADSTAIYALGHLSVARCRPHDQHQLVAFWAPFLLLHLGGPDNITAYALEDNRLWLRHLQTLAVQALGAAYVVYKYILLAGSGGTGTSLLLAASISMFAAGLVKYGERVWALERGNISSISSSFDRPVESLHQSFPRQPLTDEESLKPVDDDEKFLLQAHSHFDICKAAFTDATTKKRDSSVNSQPHRDGQQRSSANPEAGIQDYLKLYRLVEMELSLMYDILYTKAAVIHTWYGFSIHSISLLGTFTAFLLFQLGVGSGRDGYSRVDVVISYVLLAGALVLEAMSLCRALLSSWTCSVLDGKAGSGWKHLLRAIASLRRCVQPASRRLWSGSIGQYNLLEMCCSDRNDTRSRLAKTVGLDNWWTKQRFSGTFSGSECCSLEDLKSSVFIAMKPRRPHDPTVNMDLDRRIVVWHIVTNLFIWLPLDVQVDKTLVEATKVLSNYMMFLLVVKPDMLPGRTRHNVYLNACNELNSHWSDCSDKWKVEAESWPPPDALVHWLLANLGHALDSDGNKSDRRSYGRYIEIDDDIQVGTEGATEEARDVYKAIQIYNRFLSGVSGSEDGCLKIIGVWVDMMMYIGEQCSRESHARHLSYGGEFITIMWLMARHL